MTLKTLVITGANGYLGRNTITAAISDGWNVIGIVRRQEAAREVESLGGKAIILENFEVNSLKKTFTDCKAIIHFRGVVCGPKKLFEKINIDGMKILVKAAKETNVPRIIFPSGLGIERFGEIEWATNDYFRSKMEAEQILKDSGVPFIIFRPSYILGPKDELIPDLIEQIGEGTVYLAGKGDVPMQPIFVKDAIKAFLAAADGMGENNQTFDLVGPEITTMSEIVKLVLNTMKQFGFNIPIPRILKIPYEEAPDQLEICKEMIDVMRCDTLSDGSITAKALNYNLTELSEAIASSVKSKMFSEQSNSEKRAIILLSGGIDSATALFWAKKEGYDLIALSYNYHLRPKKERRATLKLAERVGIEVIEIPVEFMKEAIDLRIEGYPIPSAVESPEGFIPTRNLVFYSIAAYYADVYGCKYIIGGHIAGDQAKFPDANSAFFTILEDLVQKSKHSKDKSKIKFILPLIKLNKKDVIRLANDLIVPFEYTWSCYSDGKQPCGKCSSCVQRIEAFNQLGLSDKKVQL